MRSFRRVAPWVAVAALTVTTAAVTSAARAQSADAPPEAIESYRQAREHFEAGAYPQAAAALEEALRHDPDSPTLVYNLARVYELMGELDAALEQYQRYQMLLPQQQAREQEQADATIRRLEGARANQTPEEEAAPPPREVAPLRQLPGIVLVRERGVADAPFWVTLGVGVLGLASGAIFGGLALEASGRAEDFVLGPDGTRNTRTELHDRAFAFGIATDVSLGVGGAGLVAAGLLYFLREQTVERAPVGARDEARLDLDVTPDRLGVTMRGTL